MFMNFRGKIYTLTSGNLPGVLECDLLINLASSGITSVDPPRELAPTAGIFRQKQQQ